MGGRGGDPGNGNGGGGDDGGKGGKSWGGDGDGQQGPGGDNGWSKSSGGVTPVTHNSVLGSLQSTFASTSLGNDGGSSSGGQSSLLDFQKQVQNVVASNNLPTLGGAVVPTEPANGVGAASAPTTHQQGGVGHIDDGIGWWQDRGGVMDPHNRH